MHILSPTIILGTALCDGKRATMVGTDGNDTFLGTLAVDVIVALGGDDSITGIADDDVICAGAGDDTVISVPGVRDLPGNSLTVYGEDGDDEIIDHGLGATTDCGDGADHVLFDPIDGTSTEMAVLPGPGDDVIETPRTDVALYVDYSAAPRGIRVNLTLGVALGWGKDTLIGVNSAIGTPFNDVLIGNELPNGLAGGEVEGVSPSSEDYISGLGGGDFLSGLGVLLGGEGDDFLYPYAGGMTTAIVTDDTFDGGPGRDRLDFAEVRSALSWDLRLDTVTGTAAGTDFIPGIEDASGSAMFDDIMIGDDGPNYLDGGDRGVEKLFGLGGDDTLNGQSSSDYLDGGDGFDELSGGPEPDTCVNGEILYSCER